MTYKPDQVDIAEARDEMDACLNHAAFVERKGNAADAARYFAMALAAERSYQRIKREYLDNLWHDKRM